MTEQVEGQSSDLSIHETIETQTSRLDESLLGSSPNTADRDSAPSIHVEHSGDTAAEQQQSGVASTGDGSTLGSMVISTVGMLGETISDTIRRLSDTAVQMGKYYWSDTEGSEKSEVEDEDLTEEATEEDDTDQTSADEEDAGRNSDDEEEMENAQFDINKAMDEAEKTAKEVVANTVKKALENKPEPGPGIAKDSSTAEQEDTKTEADSEEEDEIPDEMESAVDCREKPKSVLSRKGKSKSADSRTSARAVTFHSSSTLNVRDPKALGDLTRLMRALRNDAAVMKNLLNLSNTSQVRVALQELASDAAAGDRIFSKEVQETCDSCGKDTETVTLSPEGDGRQSKTTNTEYTSKIVMESGAALHDQDSIIRSPRMKANSWVEGALDSVEAQRVSVSSVQKVTMLSDDSISAEDDAIRPATTCDHQPSVIDEILERNLQYLDRQRSMRRSTKMSDNRPQLFDKLLERNCQFLKRDKPAFDSVVMQARRESQWRDSERQSSDSCEDADSDRHGTVVVIDSQASAYLDEEAPNAKVEMKLPSSIFVFGAPPGKGTDEVAKIVDCFRNASGKQNDCTETDDESSTLSCESKRKDCDEKDRKPEGRIPCGVCPCCKKILNTLGEYSSCTSSDSQTCDERKDVSSCLWTSDSCDDSSEVGRRNVVLDDDLRKRDPKEWLRFATAAFLKGGDIRRVFLKESCMLADCKRKSRTPSPSGRQDRNKNIPCTKKSSSKSSPVRLGRGIKSSGSKACSEGGFHAQRRRRSLSRPMSCDWSKLKPRDCSLGPPRRGVMLLDELQPKRSSSPSSSCLKRRSDSIGCLSSGAEDDCEEQLRWKARQFVTNSWLTEDMEIPRAGSWSPVSGLSVQKSIGPRTESTVVTARKPCSLLKQNTKSLPQKKTVTMRL